MLITREQLDQFHAFAAEQFQENRAEISLDQLVNLWKCERGDRGAAAEDLAAVRAAVDDMLAGDEGEPAEQVLADVRRRLGL